MTIFEKIADNPTVRGCVEWFQETAGIDQASVMTPSISEQLMIAQRALVDANEQLDAIVDALQGAPAECWTEDFAPTRENVVEMVGSVVHELNWMLFLKSLPAPLDQMILLDPPIEAAVKKSRVRRKKKPAEVAAPEMLLSVPVPKTVMKLPAPAKKTVKKAAKTRK